MVHSNFAFLCDAASQGAEGKINALGIGVSQLRAQQIPVQRPMIAVVAQVAFDADEAGAKPLVIRVIDADGGNVIAPAQGQIALAASEGALSPVAHIVLELNMLTFPKYGMYSVEVDVGGESIASLPLEVSAAA